MQVRSADWAQDWQKLLSSVGCTVGIADAALFHKFDQMAQGAVHGDNFVC